MFVNDGCESCKIQTIREKMTYVGGRETEEEVCFAA